MSGQYALVSWLQYGAHGFVSEMIVRVSGMVEFRYQKTLYGTPVLLLEGCRESYYGWIRPDGKNSEFDERYGWKVEILVPL